MPRGTSALTVTVSQLNRYIKAVLEEDRKLQDLYVKGEIVNCNCHYKSGHIYFHLKDDQGSVKAVMFRSYAEDLRFRPEDGMNVLVRANVGVYERDGAYQLYVTDMQPEGVGSFAVAFEQLKERLQKQGLFDPDHKQPLPHMPLRIGVVTSETGAALQDIINVLSRRYPLAQVVLSPATVQGAEAPRSLIRALGYLDRNGGCDVIILGRGGGSAEDLWAFNDEKLAHAVFQANTPIVSAVGHETDYTICDLVADLRAPTPSAAAELVSPSVDELERSVGYYGSRIRQIAADRMASSGERLGQIAASRALSSPMEYVRIREEKLDFLRGTLYNRKCIFIQTCEGQIRQKMQLLDSLSPLRVLERGYCAAFTGGEPVTLAENLQPGQALSVRFRDGTAHTTVQTVDREESNG